MVKSYGIRTLMRIGFPPAMAGRNRVVRRACRAGATKLVFVADTTEMDRGRTRPVVSTTASRTTASR
jgi:hypothetical protein